MAKKKTGARKKTTAEAPPLSFEESLARLEHIVRQLEDGGLELGESLTQYEQGVKHLNACYEALQQAERKIELLAGVDADGRPISEPYDDRELSVEEKRQTRGARRTRTGPASSDENNTPSERMPRRSAEDDIDEPQGLF